MGLGLICVFCAFCEEKDYHKGAECVGDHVGYFEKTVGEKGALNDLHEDAVSCREAKKQPAGFPVGVFPDGRLIS